MVSVHLHVYAMGGKIVKRKRDEKRKKREK